MICCKWRLLPEKYREVQKAINMHVTENPNVSTHRHILKL
jgi:hypothetical protein